jgi:hypothetical protein
MPTGLLDLDRRDGAHSPVERAVRLGLGRSDGVKPTSK